MLFNSLQFAAFLPIVFAIYWLLPKNYKWFVILISSYYFYMSWSPKYALLILFTTLLSFCTGLLLESISKKSVCVWGGGLKTNRLKKAVITISIILCAASLLLFKYADFVLEIVFSMISFVGFSAHPVTLGLMIPVGISFYTFQTISYILDVYRGDVQAEHHFGKYAAFISFFPQLVAGPIERTGNLLPQIKTPADFNEQQAVEGLRSMLWGFFKKLAIADVLAVYVDQVFENITAYEGFSLIIAAVFFSIQIYCDFSGYSDIAIGCAKLFGITLVQNFKSPYWSVSIRQFWRRWHISLTSWLRDYIYIPAGGSRCSAPRRDWNLLLTFLISGLWHGADFTYIAWGGIHGFANILEAHFQKKESAYRLFSLKKITDWISCFLVFLFCTAAWVLFRAKSFSDAIYLYCHSFAGIGSMIHYLKLGFVTLEISKKNILSIVLTLVILLTVDFMAQSQDIFRKYSERPAVVRWIGYYVMIFLIFLLGNFGSQQFVYFQF